MLDRFLIIRDSVNTDVFMNGDTPETLWGGEEKTSLSDEDSKESADIFFTAMANDAKVVKVAVDALISG